jgi:hypothetical protein
MSVTSAFWIIHFFVKTIVIFHTINICRLTAICNITSDASIKLIDFHLEFAVRFIENNAEHLLLMTVYDDKVSPLSWKELGEFFFNNFLEPFHVRVSQYVVKQLKYSGLFISLLLEKPSKFFCAHKSLD